MDMTLEQWRERAIRAETLLGVISQIATGQVAVMQPMVKLTAEGGGKADAEIVDENGNVEPE